MEQTTSHGKSAVSEVEIILLLIKVGMHAKEKKIKEKK